MAQVWQSYLSDLGRSYPMLGVSVAQVNDISTNTNPLELLPTAIQDSWMRVRNVCDVPGLTPRVLILWLGDGSQFRLTYPQPFSENLADYLTATPDIAAWEFVGERIKYGRLRRLLDHVQP